MTVKQYRKSIKTLENVSKEHEKARTTVLRQTRELKVGNSPILEAREKAAEKIYRGVI